MQGLHFSTTDLRNKLSRSHITNNCPIIAEVTVGNNATTHIRVDIYLPAQSCWWEIRGYLHKEMNLHIKASYYEALCKNSIFLPWTIAFQPPLNLMSNQCQIDTIIAPSKTQAQEMLTTLSTMSTQEANECKHRANASTKP